MKRLFFSLLFFFNLVVIKAQHYYNVPGAYIQPQFAAPLYFEDANGNRDTLYFGYDSLAHDIPYHQAYDSLLGSNKVFVDTNSFYASWGIGLLHCGNHFCDSIYKVNISPFTNCGSYCFPSNNEILVNNGVFPLKISWDISVFRNDSFPFPDQSPAPRGQGNFHWDYPWTVEGSENGHHINWEYVLVSDTIVNAFSIVKDSITLFDALGNHSPTISGFMTFYFTAWNGLLTGVESIKNENRIFIFPNPSNGIINFSTDEKQSCELKIINAIGEIIITKQFIEGKTTISDLNPGIYFAQLMQNGRLLNVQKFVVIK